MEFGFAPSGNGDAHLILCFKIKFCYVIKNYWSYYEI
jgi:hypothetical protein